MIERDEWAALREDVGYIKAKIEIVEDHEVRIRDLEQKWWQFPLAAIFALFGASGHHLP